MVDSNRPPSHLGDERDRGRRAAHRTPAGQRHDRRQSRTARGRGAHPDRGSDDPATRRLGVHRAHLDRGGSAPHQSAVAQDREGYPRPRHTDHHSRSRLDSQRDRVPGGLEGYWHGYIGSDEPALANAVAMAYPRQVERIQRGTRAPDRASAAATLLEQLIRPGFDPAQGAEATRRYVRRKASIVVMEHRKAEAPDRYPWTQAGISERRYYKLLPQFALKVNGRYVLDHDDVVARMKAYLDRVDQVRAVRAAALDVLRAHGFGEEAARKWLQRHRPEEAVNAWPRG